MSKMSVREFKDYCESISPNTFIISSENQNDVPGYLPKADLVFNSMAISFNPNTFLFRSGKSSMTFRSVKHIVLDDEKNALGTVFSLICDDFQSCSECRSYTIICR